MKLKTIGFILSIVVVVGLVYYVLSQFSDIKPNIVEKTKEQKIEILKKAYTGEPFDLAKLSAEEQEYVAIANKTMASIVTAIETNDINLYMESINMDLMLDYALKLVDMRMSRAQKREFKRKNREITKASLPSFSFMLEAYKNAKVVHIDRRSDDEFVVYFKMLMPEFETVSRQRYWFRKNKKGTWQYYDHEDFDEGYRYTTILSTLLRQTKNNRMSAEVKDSVNYIQSLRAVDTEDVNSYIALEKSASAVLSHKKLPEELRVLALQGRASSYLNQEKYEECLKDLQAIEKSSIYVPVMHFLFGNCYYGMENYPKAIEAYTQYGESLGFDFETYQRISYAYEANSDLVNAKKFARLAYEDRPEDLDLIIDYDRFLENSEKSIIVKAFAASGKEEEGYIAMIQIALDEDDKTTAIWYLAKFKEKFPTKESYINLFQGRLDGKYDSEGNLIPGSTESPDE